MDSQAPNKVFGKWASDGNFIKDIDLIMEICKYFVPNRVTHPEFADMLKIVRKNGVNIRELNFLVGPDELKINKEIEIRL